MAATIDTLVDLTEDTDDEEDEDSKLARLKAIAKEDEEDKKFDIVPRQKHLCTVVDGEPKSLERCRFTVRGGKKIAFLPTKSKEVKKKFVEAFKRARFDKKRVIFPAGTPVELEVHFKLRRPNKHFVNNNRHSENFLKIKPEHEDSMVMAASVRKDCDNMAKLIQDAGNGIAHDDDVQVAKLVARKSCDSDGTCEGQTVVNFWKAKKW